MKKFLVSIVALSALCVSQAFAIHGVPAPGWTQTVNFGMTVSNLRGIKSDPKVGYDASLLFEYMFKGGKGTYINFGPEFSMQGCKWDDDKLRTHYLSVPVHIGFRNNITRKVGLYGEFGPYFGLGLGGKFDPDHGPKQKFFANDDGTGWDADRFDCGIGFRIGAEFKRKLSLNFGFNWGLTEPLDKEPLDDAQTFTSTITLGYRF